MVQFGATTYTSLAKGIQKAALLRKDYRHALKGHMPEDQKAFTVELVLDEKGKNDKVVIASSSHLPKANNGKGYRETLPVRNDQGEIKKNLRDELRKAFQRAKAGELLPAKEFVGYIKDNVQRIYDRTVLKALNKTLKQSVQPSYLETYKASDETLLQAMKEASTQMDAFFKAESDRIDRAHRQGNLTDAALNQYRTRYQEAITPFAEVREANPESYLFDGLKASRRYEGGKLSPEEFLQEKQRALETIRETFQKR